MPNVKVVDRSNAWYLLAISEHDRMRGLKNPPFSSRLPLLGGQDPLAQLPIRLWRFAVLRTGSEVSHFITGPIRELTQRDRAAKDDKPDHQRHRWIGIKAVRRIDFPHDHRSKYDADIWTVL